MTKQDILDRMAAGERLRWVSREVSGKPIKKKSERHIRDLFLGKQELTEDESVLAESLEESGDIICEDTFDDDIIRCWLPGESPL